MNRLFPAATLVMATTLAVPLLGKGPTVKITLSGPGLSQPVDLTSAAAVAPNVWTGDFAVWERGEVAAPAANQPRYVVQFHTEASGGSELSYVVYLSWDPATDQALIHLPARDGAWYRLNIGTILRDGQDGNWYHADPAWAEAIRRELSSF